LTGPGLARRERPPPPRETPSSDEGIFVSVGLRRGTAGFYRSPHSTLVAPSPCKALYSLSLFFCYSVALLPLWSGRQLDRSPAGAWLPTDLRFAAARLAGPRFCLTHFWTGPRPWQAAPPVGLSLATRRASLRFGRTGSAGRRVGGRCPMHGFPRRSPDRPRTENRFPSRLGGPFRSPQSPQFFYFHYQLSNARVLSVVFFRSPRCGRHCPPADRI